MKKDIFLEDMLIGKWEKIVLQGGKLKRKSPFNENYMISYLAFYNQDRWADVSIIETIRDEEFDLQCRIMRNPPIPDMRSPEFRCYPPLEFASEFPADCPLNELMDYGVKTIKYDSYLFNNDKEVTIKGDLEIISLTGKKFIITPDTMPYMFEIYCLDS